jgi:hypothetical protein
MPFGTLIVIINLIFFKGGVKHSAPTKDLRIKDLALVAASATFLSSRSLEQRRRKGRGSVTPPKRVFNRKNESL